MTTQGDATGTPVQRALRAWRREAASIERITSGAANEHWGVVTDAGERYVIRRYNERLPRGATAYEHDLLWFLADREWPVAPPLPTASGATSVEDEGGRWALFPYLPGDPPPDTGLFLQRKGAVLALLHEDLSSWDRAEQRSGFERVNGLDACVRPEFDSLASALEWLRERSRSAAAVLSDVQARNGRQLERLGYDRLPDTVIYFECLGANVLFEDDTVSGLLDFDLAHRDARVVDIARSVVVDCGPDQERIYRWISGYAAHASPKLSIAEVDVLPAALVAAALWNIANALPEAARAGDEAALASALASLEDLVSFDALQGELASVIRMAAGAR